MFHTKSRMRQQGYKVEDLREVFDELDEDGSGSIQEAKNR
jgi:Ca2+-binding EF-hand superfamily protein